MFKFLNFPTCFSTYSLEDSVTEITIFCLFFLIYSQLSSLKYMHTSAHTHTSKLFGDSHVLWYYVECFIGIIGTGKHEASRIGEYL